MLRLQLAFATLEIVPGANIVLGRPHESAVISFDNMQEICSVGVERFQRAPWVYVSIRENKFESDPALYARMVALDHCAVGFAVVADTERQQLIAKFASGIGQSEVTVGFFADVESAITWAKRLLLRATSVA